MDDATLQQWGYGWHVIAWITAHYMGAMKLLGQAAQVGPNLLRKFRAINSLITVLITVTAHINTAN